MSVEPMVEPPDGFSFVDFSSVGPPIGERFPDVELRDQHGEFVDLHGHRAGRRCLVVFHRSADW